MRWLKRLWWRLCGLCPNCGEELARQKGASSLFVDCYGCGYWRHDITNGYEHFPRAR